MLRFVSALSLLALHGTARANDWLVLQEMMEAYQFKAAVEALDDKDLPVDAWAVDTRGEWMIVGGDKVFHSKSFSPEVVDAAKWNIVFGRDILAADCNELDTCIVVHSMGWYADGPLPPGLEDKLSMYSRQGWTVRDVEITASGWTVLGSGNLASWSNPPGDLEDALSDRIVADRFIQDVAIGFDGEWALLAGQNPMTGHADPNLVWRLGEVAKDEEDVQKLLIGRSQDWVVYNPSDLAVAVDLNDPWDAVEYNLGSGNDNIWQRMEDLGAVGVSIAIVRDNQVTASRGYGLRKATQDDPVLGTTPFDVASLSKYVASLTTAAVMEDDGALSLDDDILDPAILVPNGNVDTWRDEGENNPEFYSWPAPSPTLPNGITYRRLLSHTASIRGGFGSPETPFFWVNQPYTTWERMMGYGCNTNQCGVDPDIRVWRQSWGEMPGDTWRYSNAGYLLLQASLEDRTGKSGAQLMEEHVFEPLHLQNTNAKSPMPMAFQQRIAWPHNDGVPTSTLGEFQWTFAGGVYASAGDYAEMMILALNEGESSTGQPIIPNNRIVPMMQTVETEQEGFGNYYGLGLGVSDIEIGEWNQGSFSHSGRHRNRARSKMCGAPWADTGIVVLINTDETKNDGDDRMNTLRNDVVRAFRNALGLPSC